jgi:hypothetical protein
MLRFALTNILISYPKLLTAQTDGSDCLSGTSGLVCCPSNSPGTDGCMYAGSVCCGYGAYCATGQFCSPPNNGEVNCCFDSACETVVYSGGVPVVPYTEASLFTASPTAAGTTTATGSPQATGKSTPTTKPSGSATNASPAATKTSAGEKMVQVDLMAGLLVPLFAIAWTVLGAQL